jgi:hypothetical protein
VGTGLSIANAANQGNNPGTAPIDPSTGQMDQNAFGYGGGIQSQPQQGAQQALSTADEANRQATMHVNVIQDELKKARAAAAEDPSQAPRVNALIQQLVGAQKNQQATGAAFSQAQAAAQNAPGLAQSEANRYQGLAQAADNRQGVQMNLDQYNQSRGQTQNALGLTQAAAEGNAPSVAAMQLRQGLDQANNQAAGMAAGARGGGGNLALAARSAIQQQGQNAMTTNQNAAMLRANEMATARGQYLQGAQGMENTDLTQSGQQAALNAQQRGLNDARNQYYEGGLQKIYGAQQAGMSGYQQQQAQNNIGIANANHGYADKRFSDQQAAQSGALEMGGRTFEGLSRIPKALKDASTSASAEDDAPKGAANPY